MFLSCSQAAYASISGPSLGPLLALQPRGFTALVSGRTGIKSHEVDLDDFERVFRVNVNGIFLMSKAVLPVMLSQGPKGSGRICNIASISGKEGNAGMLAYSSSKAAVSQCV